MSEKIAWRGFNPKPANEEAEAPFRVVAGADLPVSQALGTAPVIFVDGAAGAAVGSDLVRFNLYHDCITMSPEWTGQPGKEITRIICARLVMSRATAVAIHRWLGDALQGTEHEPGNSP